MKPAQRLITAAVALGLLATAARAGEAAETGKATVTLARHFTTNALDGPVAIADWYTHLRGTLTRTVSHGPGDTTLSAGLDIRRYDTLAIENDAALTLGTETALRLSESVELRGTLALRLVDDGDDIAVGDLIIGTRTPRATLSGGLQAGIRLAPGTVLVMEGSASREHVGRARFEDGIAPPERLEPNRTRLRAGAGLTATRGGFSYRVAVAGGLMRSDESPLLAGFDRLDAAARMLGAATFGKGAAISAELGVETITVAGIHSATRPAYAVAVSAPLGDTLSLRASLRAGYDLASTDDPLVVWARRLELEAGYQPSPALRIGIGAFDELREFTAYGTRENGRGAYAELAWTGHGTVTVLLRIDAAKRRLMPLDLPRDSIEVKAALTAAL